MTSAAEFQAKVTKAATNMDRLDGIVNGGPTVEVETDGGIVPSFANVLANFGGGGAAPSRAYATKAALDADLVPSEGTLAAVYADSDATLNGLYRKVGATTAGSWTEIDALGGDLSEVLDAVAAKLDATPEAIVSVLGFIPIDKSKVLPRYNVEAWRKNGSTTRTDGQTLQAAIDAVNALGGGVLASEYGYYVTTNEVGLKANVILDGLKLRGKPGSAGTGTDVIIMIPGGSDNAVIRNCIFDGTAMKSRRSTGGSHAISQPTGVNSYNLHILDNSFTMVAMSHAGDDEYQGCACCVMNGFNGVFSGNRSTQCAGDTFNFNAPVAIVTNNIIDNGGDGGIAFNNFVFGIIANNYITQCSLGIGMGITGGGNNYSRVLVTGNVIAECDYGLLNGTFGNPGAQQDQYLKITGNHIMRCTQAGISYGGGDTSSSANLHITDNLIGNAGKFYTNSAVSGAGGRQGMIVNNARGSVITGNSVANSGTAYYFNYTYDCVFSGNSAVNCDNDVLWVTDNSAIVGDNYYVNTPASPVNRPQFLISGRRPRLVGTTDGGGAVSVPHGLNASMLYRVRSIFAVVVTSGGVAYPMALSNYDGTNFYFTSPVASRPCYVNFEMGPA